MEGRASGGGRLTTKICRLCKVEKSISEFHHSSRHCDGFDSRCKSCKKILSKDYYKNNQLKSNQSTKKYRDSHPEKVKELSDNYKKSHPARLKAIYALKNHRQRGDTTLVSTKFVEMLFKNTQVCLICGVEMTAGYGRGLTNASKSLDVIDNDTTLREDNVQVICHGCNSTKRDRTMVEFVDYCAMVVRKFKHGTA